MSAALRRAALALAGQGRTASSSGRSVAAAVALAASRDSRGFASSATPTAWDETYNRQRSILPLEDRVPSASPDSWVAPSAVVAGDVDVYDKCVVWYRAVLRGDAGAVRVGHGCSIGEGAVLGAAGEDGGAGLTADTWLEGFVRVGPRAALRACHVEEGAEIGARSVVCEGARIGAGARLLPGTVVPPGRLIPAGEVWGGVPARFVRDLLPHEADETRRACLDDHAHVAQSHREGSLPQSLAYIEAATVRAKLRNEGLIADSAPRCTPPDPWAPFEFQRDSNTSGGM